MMRIENALEPTADMRVGDGLDGFHERASGQMPIVPGPRRPRGPITGPTSTAIYARRHAVFDEHQPADAIYQVITGGIIVTRSANGTQRKVVEIVGPGGLVGVVSGTHYGCRAETITRSLLRRITRRTIERSAPLQRVLSQALTQKLEKLHEETSLRTRMSATECVAAMILSLPRAEPERANPEADGIDHRLAVAQSEMASYLGLAIETVCRAMKNLKRMGCIQTAGRDTIAILDDASLARLAAPDRAASAAVD